MNCMGYIIFFGEDTAIVLIENFSDFTIISLGLSIFINQRCNSSDIVSFRFDVFKEFLFISSYCLFKKVVFCGVTDLSIVLCC